MCDDSHSTTSKNATTIAIARAIAAHQAWENMRRPGLGMSATRTDCASVMNSRRLSGPP